MQIALTGKNFDVPEDTRSYVQTKLSKLMRLYKRIERSTVTLTEKASKSKAQACKVEIMLHIPGADLHSVELGETHRAALDVCIEKLAQQLSKVKGRLVDKQQARTKTQGREPAARPAPKAAAKSAPKRAGRETADGTPLVYVEKFSLKPMGTRDAILQLKTAKRGFYLFYNSAGNLNCIYKRDDGHYGLVVPETEIEE